MAKYVKRTLLTITIDALKKEQSKVQRKAAKYRVEDFKVASERYTNLYNELCEKLKSGVESKDMQPLLEQTSAAEKQYLKSLNDKDYEIRTALEFELQMIEGQIKDLEYRKERGEEMFSLARCW